MRAAIVSIPPIPVPSTAPLPQSTRSSPRSGRASPASCQASTAAMLAKRWLEFMASSSSSAKYEVAIASTP
jgi:hypothetical protein